MVILINSINPHEWDNSLGTDTVPNDPPDFGFCVNSDDSPCFDDTSVIVDEVFSPTGSKVFPFCAAELMVQFASF